MVIGPRASGRWPEMLSRMCSSPAPKTMREATLAAASDTRAAVNSAFRSPPPFRLAVGHVPPLVMMRRRPVGMGIVLPAGTGADWELPGRALVASGVSSDRGRVTVRGQHNVPGRRAAATGNNRCGSGPTRTEPVPGPARPERQQHRARLASAGIPAQSKPGACHSLKLTGSRRTG